MGCGEGVTFPTIQAAVARWIPKKGRSRALSSVYAGAQGGTIVSLLVAPWLIQTDGIGWEGMFIVFGTLGFLWLPLWLPQQDYPQPGTVQGVLNPGDKQPKLADLDWGALSRSKSFLGLMVAHMAWACGHYTILAWLPSFYAQQYGLDVKDSAIYSIVPWVATFGCTSVSGWVADWLINSGRLPLVQTRKLMNGIAFLAPSLALTTLLILQPEDPNLALVFMTLTLATGGFSAAGYASNHQDIATKTAPLLFGITNGMSSISGSAAVWATGLILEQTHDWSDVWGTVIIVYVIGTVIFTSCVSGEKEFE